MTAGILCVALAGGSIGAWQLQAGGIDTVHAVVEDETRAAGEARHAAKQAKAQDADKAETNENQKSKEDTEQSLTEQLVSMLDTEQVQSLDAKEEKVYLIADANGNAKHTNVSNWLKNGSANAQIHD